jgi:hypothetical protein
MCYLRKERSRRTDKTSPPLAERVFDENSSRLPLHPPTRRSGLPHRGREVEERQRPPIFDTPETGLRAEPKDHPRRAPVTATGESRANAMQLRGLRTRPRNPGPGNWRNALNDRHLHFVLDSRGGACYHLPIELFLFICLFFISTKRVVS